VSAVALTRQSRPDSGLGFQVKVLKAFQVVTSSLGSGISKSVWRVKMEALSLSPFEAELKFIG